MLKLINVLMKIFIVLIAALVIIGIVPHIAVAENSGSSGDISYSREYDSAETILNFTQWEPVGYTGESRRTEVTITVAGGKALFCLDSMRVDLEIQMERVQHQRTRLEREERFLFVLIYIMWVLLFLLVGPAFFRVLHRTLFNNKSVKQEIIVTGQNLEDEHD